MAAARESAAKWSALGVVPGDRVVFSLPTSWDLIHAWLGALYRGILPVIAAPMPPFGDVRAGAVKLHQLALALDARCLVASGTWAAQFVAPSGCKVLTAVQWAGTTPGRSAAVQVEGSATAFLQLTSGTSALPRAVEISHDAARHNIIAAYAALAVASDTSRRIDSVVSWLPLHHDLGLVGAFLFSIVTGCELCLMPPKLFLAQPQLWFERIAAAGAVVSGSPNFGLQLCIDRRSKFPSDLDLSGFAAAHGLPPHMLRPAYGLAEATVAVTMDRAGRGPRTLPAPRHTGRRFALADVVCVGAPLAGTELRIASPDGNAVADGREGQVLVRGPGLFSGYFGDRAATRKALRGGSLRTGDLGFMRQGELYVTGRRDDRMIVRGDTLNPHELEWIAEELAGAGDGCRAAAFSIACGNRGEQVIVIVETLEQDRSRLERLEIEIRERTARRLALQLADLAFVRRGRLPRTTSGKIRRAAARALYEQGALTGSDASRPAGPEGTG